MRLANYGTKSSRLERNALTGSAGVLPAAYEMWVSVVAGRMLRSQIAALRCMLDETLVVHRSQNSKHRSEGMPVNLYLERSICNHNFSPR